MADGGDEADDGDGDGDGDGSLLGTLRVLTAYLASPAATATAKTKSFGMLAPRVLRST